MAFMAWLVPVLGWFALTVLRGRRDRFAAGAIGIGFLVVLVLHLINPDRLIARTKLARAREGRPFDASYAATLSRDAWPELIAALPRLSSSDRCLLVRRFREEEYDWRSWNLSRMQANELMRRHAPELNAWRTSCPPLTSRSGDYSWTESESCSCSCWWVG